MKHESLSNELILNIINSLHPEITVETLKETQYYPEGSDESQIQSLDSVSLTDLIIKSFNETDIPNQVIYLNTDDNLITIYDISGDDIQENNLNENPNWHHLGYISTEDPLIMFNLYLYID